MNDMVFPLIFWAGPPRGASRRDGSGRQGEYAEILVGGRVMSLATVLLGSRQPGFCDTRHKRPIERPFCRRPLK
jgi:hypothetical protein